MVRMWDILEDIPMSPLKPQTFFRGCRFSFINRLLSKRTGGRPRARWNTDLTDWQSLSRAEAG